MKSNRWFWLAVLFLLINGYGVFRVTEYFRQAGGGVRVISVVPGEGKYLQRSDEIQWVFSSEMAGPDEVDRWLEIGPVRFTPQVPGHFCWDRPDRLSFIPAQPWTACWTIIATLDEDLTSRDGKALAGKRVFEMGTEPLRLLTAGQTDIGHRRRVSLRLEFNGPVSAESLASELTLAGPGGEEVDYRIEGKSGGKVVVLKTESLPVGWEYLNFELDESLQSTSGPRGLTDPVREKVAISDDLALLSLKPRMNRVSGGAVEVSFTAPLNLESALTHISFNPPVDLTIEEEYSYGSRSRYLIRGNFEPGRTYSLTLSKGLPGLSGAGLIEDVVRNVYFPDRPSSLDFSHSGHYLSAAGQRLVPVTTVNLNKFKVTIDRIYPNNLVQFAMREADNYSGYYGMAIQGLTERVGEEEIAVSAVPNQPRETMIDLKKYPGAARAGAYWITIDSEETGSEGHLVVVTDIGLAVRVSPRDILVWANSIRSLAPVAGGEVRIYSSANQEIASGFTDQDGLAHISLEDSGEKAVPFLVTLARGEDISYIALDGAEVPGLEEPGGRPYLKDGYEAYLTTFRGVCRPGEVSSVTAIVRGADLKAPSPFPVIFRLLRPDGKEDRRETDLLSDDGTASAEFKLADYAMTGRYRVDCLVPGSSEPLGTTSFLVEEFVPPRIEVEVQSDEGRCGIEDELNFAVGGRHLFGAPAAGNPVQGWVVFRPEEFNHPRWPGYRFGDPEKSGPVINRKLGNSHLDEEGVALFSVEIPDGLFPPAACRAQFGCTVLENGGRPISAYASRIVDPYPFYIGLRPEKDGGYYPAGDEIKFEVAAVRPDGELSDGVRELELRVNRITWATVLKQNASGRYSYTSERNLQPVNQGTVSIKEGRGRISFTLPQPGRYLLKVEDPDSGSSTSLKIYAGSPDQEWIAWSMERPERVELSLDQERYRPGDTASLLIKSPFSGLALVTVESDRVLDRWIVPLKKNTAAIPIPIKEIYGPNSYCSISVIRKVSPGEKWAPHRASGSIPLLLDNSGRRLEVSIGAPETVRPREKLTVSIAVADREGTGVPSRVVLAAVDEGICDLTGFRLPDPFAFFLGRRSLMVKLFDIYSFLMPEIEPGIDGSSAAPGGGGPEEEEALKGRLNPVGARRFQPVALCSGWVETDVSGRAAIEFDLPEFTGELRLMALAVSGGAFGAAQDAVAVKRPLVVQSSLPRFLAPGDHCRMMVRIFNETGEDGTVRVEAECRGGLLIEAGGNRVEHALKNISLSVGKSGAVEFDVVAPPLPGLASIRLRAVMGDEVFEEETELSVRPVSPLQSRAGAGMVRPGETEKVDLPGDWFEGTGRYQLRASGRAVVQLGESLTGLLQYPYGCIEQTTSTAFPLIYLADISAEILPGAIGEEECTRLVAAGIHRIFSMQLSSGGFSYWPLSTEEYRWGSIYAAHFLVEAEKAGYEIPAGRIESACRYLRDLLDLSPPPVDDSASRRFRDLRTIKSYAALVLARAGKPEPGWTARLAEENETLDRSGILYLTGAFIAEGRRREALKLLSLLPAKNDPDPVREQGGCLQSGIRDEALELSIRLDINPEDPAIPVLVRRLSGKSRMTTQENAMVLMALGKYCRYSFGQPDSFKALISGVPDQGEMEFGEEDECSFQWEGDRSGSIRISNKGPGTVYYSWSSEGVPATGIMKEEDRGIIVRRRFLDTEGEEIDISILTQGELAVAEILVDAGSDGVDNLVITDLLPAGLEIENAALKTSRLVSWVKKKSTLPLRHTESRDDRLIAFAGSFSGKKKFYYLLRAVTPGDYIYPPVSAEAMYDPDIMSVSGGGRIIID